MRPDSTTAREGVLLTVVGPHGGEIVRAAGARRRRVRLRGPAPRKDRVLSPGTASGHMEEVDRHHGIHWRTEHARACHQRFGARTGRVPNRTAVRPRRR